MRGQQPDIGREDWKQVNKQCWCLWSPGDERTINLTKVWTKFGSFKFSNFVPRSTRLYNISVSGSVRRADDIIDKAGNSAMHSISEKSLDDKVTSRGLLHRRACVDANGGGPSATSYHIKVPPTVR